MYCLVSGFLLNQFVDKALLVCYHQCVVVVLEQGSVVAKVGILNWEMQDQQQGGQNALHA
jgi:hypothetical protein